MSFLARACGTLNQQFEPHNPTPPQPSDPPPAHQPKFGPMVMGHKFDDGFNAGWDEGALPQGEPPVTLVRIVGVHA